MIYPRIKRRRTFSVLNEKTVNILIESFTVEEREDWTHLGLIPDGPVWNHFDVTEPDTYVCSFEMVDFTLNPEGKRVPLVLVYDLYIHENRSWGEQTLLLRSNEEWEGSYGSSELGTALSISHKPWSQALHILRSLGHLKWKRKEPS